MSRLAESERAQRAALGRLAVIVARMERYNFMPADRLAMLQEASEALDDLDAPEVCEACLRPPADPRCATCRDIGWIP